MKFKNIILSSIIISAIIISYIYIDPLAKQQEPDKTDYSLKKKKKINTTNIPISKINTMDYFIFTLEKKQKYREL
jgi:hypothetical protein